MTFPASAGTYNTAGWNAGCGTIGFCGTYSDAGSGVSRVQISIRQGTRQLLERPAPSRARSEVWNTATHRRRQLVATPSPPASFPADGGYTIRVRATDAAGNVETPSSRTFTIDRAAPQTTIDSNPTNPTGSTSATFTFSSSEGGSTFECRIDGGAWGACTSPAQLHEPHRRQPHLRRARHRRRRQHGQPRRPPTPGSSTRRHRPPRPPSRRRAGEYNATGWAAGCGDRRALRHLLGRHRLRRLAGAGLHPPGRGQLLERHELRERAPRSGTRATIGGGNWSYAFAAGSFPADGSYTVRVRAVDAVANTETPSTRTFTYDATNPSALFTFPAAGGNYTTATWNAGCATNGFCGTHSDAARRRPGGRRSRSCASRPASTGTGRRFASGDRVLPDRDARGRQLVAGLPGGELPGRRPVHRPRARDATTRRTPRPARRARSGSTTPPRPPRSRSPPRPGRTTRPAGTRAAPRTASAAPTPTRGSGVQGVEVSIRQGAGNYWNGTSFASGTEVWNTATLAGGNWSLTFPAASFPADGSYTVRVRATDVAGNVETPSTRTFTIDRAAPQTTIDSNPSDPTRLERSHLHLQLQRGRLDLRVPPRRRRLGRLHQPAKSYTSLADGSHTFDVRATDVAGNTDASPASYTWLVDTTAPSLDGHLPGQRRHLQHGRLERRLRHQRPLRHLRRRQRLRRLRRCRSPSARARATTGTAPSFASATEVWNDATLAGGNWSLRLPRRRASPPTAATPCACARSTPSANTETPSSRTFTIDRAAPQTTIDSNPASQTSSTSAAFTFSSSEGSSTFECRIDGGAWGACTSPQATTPASRTAATPSTCAPPTSPATPTAPRPPTPGSSTPTAPDLDRHLPHRRRELHRRRVDGRLRRRRSLRHLRRRRRLRRRRGRGLHPPGLRQLLERHRLRQRHRGLERRRRSPPATGRYDLRLGRLPRRRRLHRARPRPRRRRQRRDRLEPHLRARQDRPLLRNCLPGRRRALQRRLLGRRLHGRRPLRHVLRRHVGRRSGRGLDPA